MSDPSEPGHGTIPPLPPQLTRWLFCGLLAFVAWALFVATAWHTLGWHHAWVGAWGDSFAPLTGLAAVLAVVFSARSLQMQSEQLKGMAADAAMQRAAQNEALALSSAANKLTRLGHLIEARRQLGEIDRLGAGLYKTQFGSLHPTKEWFELVHSPRGPGSDRPTATISLTPEMKSTLVQRDELEALIREWTELDRPSPPP